MKTIALRFAETFAPAEGTIQAHQAVIDKYGYVWYGKLGSKVAEAKQKEILKSKEPKILLIHSGKQDRYWAYVEEIKDAPETEVVPEYYRDDIERFKTWFKIIRFEKAENNIMSKCFVVSSKAPLGTASRFSMSPYFYIETTEQNDDL